MKKALLKFVIWLYGHPDKVIKVIEDVKDAVKSAKGGQ